MAGNLSDFGSGRTSAPVFAQVNGKSLVLVERATILNICSRLLGSKLKHRLEGKWTAVTRLKTRNGPMREEFLSRIHHLGNRGELYSLSQTDGAH